MGSARIGTNGLPVQLFAMGGQGEAAADDSGSTSNGGGAAEGSLPGTRVLDGPIDVRVCATETRHAAVVSLHRGRRRVARGKEPVRETAVRWRVTQPARLIAELATKRRAAFEATLDEAPGKQGGGSGGDGSSRLRMEVSGTWLYDTELKMRIRLTALRGVSLDDVVLHVPFHASLCRYLMGFERHGRLASSHLPFGWEWSQGSSAHQVWMGDVHAGMRLKLTGADGDAWDSPMHKVSEAELERLAWHNKGRGGVRVTRQAAVHARTGPLELAKGEVVELAFELLLTPTQPLLPRLKAHWSEERYAQVGYPSARMASPAALAQRGARVINYHQGLGVNPYINYPFLRRALARLREHVVAAHREGLRVKAYYTIRELSNHAEELWVLRALGDEILRGGSGSALDDPWLREHMGGRDYLGCWHNPVEGMHDGYDAALCNKGLSRWANYYVEGLAELLRGADGQEGSYLDGLYYDGIDFGIETIRRVRSVLQRERGSRGLLDLHSGNNNHPNHKGKYGSVSPALQYMGVLPHVDSLWLGEGFEYDNESPDYWLIEVSGLAWGTPSDLMCDRSYQGSTPWRGLLYGSFGRVCTYASSDGFQHYLARPGSIWKLADRLALSESTMFGYWQPQPPVALAPWAPPEAKVRTGPSKATERPFGTLVGPLEITQAHETSSPSRVAEKGALPSEEEVLSSCRGTTLATTYVRKGVLAMITIAHWEQEDEDSATTATAVMEGSSTPPPHGQQQRRGRREGNQSRRMTPQEQVRRRSRGRLGRQNCTLVVRWEALGLRPASSLLIAPALAGWQLPRRFELSKRAKHGDGPVGPIPIPAQRGVVLVLADMSQRALVRSLLDGECDADCEAVANNQTQGARGRRGKKEASRGGLFRFGFRKGSRRTIGGRGGGERASMVDARTQMAGGRGAMTQAAFGGRDAAMDGLERARAFAAAQEDDVSRRELQTSPPPPMVYDLKSMRQHGSHTR